MAFWLESDRTGSIEVPADRYWGAKTQRSLENFKKLGFLSAADFSRYVRPERMVNP